MKSWYADDKVDTSPIISSRIRLARNLKKYPFLSRISAEQSTRMVDETAERLKGSFEQVALEKKSEAQKRCLLERHIISPEFLKISKPKSLLLQSGERLSVMVNEEDHIRIQAISPGDDINSAWDMADKLDDLLEETLEYAFHKDYGYLTSCPTNTGTGLRASFMVHLPMLEKTGQIKNLYSAVSKFGMTIRGTHGEGTEPMGHIFQVSNQVTLGKSEAEIISALKSIVGQMIEKEDALRRKALSERKTDTIDRIYRAYGIVKYARSLTGREAMEHLSSIRMGYMLNILDEPKPKQTLYETIMNIQRGSLQMKAKKELSDSERDVARADYLRSVFSH